MHIYENDPEIQFDNKKNDEDINVSKQKIKTKSEGLTSVGTKLKSVTDKQFVKKKNNSTDLLKMIYALRDDLQSKENIDEHWLDCLKSMESHYIQENRAEQE